MEIKRGGSQPSGKGPADWFTGTVRIDPLFTTPDPARVVGASVTFEPGARTAWHTHPLGQTLIVTSGCGRAQHWGGPIEEIRPGRKPLFAVSLADKNNEKFIVIGKQSFSRVHGIIGADRGRCCQGRR